MQCVLLKMHHNKEHLTACECLSNKNVTVWLCFCSLCSTEDFSHY